LTKQLAQFKPRTLVGGKERNSSLFRIIPHEDGDEERQDEDGTEQVEGNEEDAVAPPVKVFRLGVDTSDGHTCEQHICPTFL
jgi:hypothetical protein